MRAILFDARPLVCQPPRASPSRRVAQCNRGVFQCPHRFFYSELLHVENGPHFLAFREAQANSHGRIRRMCASHFFSVSDSDRRLRRLVRVSRRRDDLCLLFPAPTSPPPTRYAGHRNPVSPSFSRIRSPRARGIDSARARRAWSVERAPVAFSRNTRRRRSISLVFFAPHETRSRSTRRAHRAGREHVSPRTSSLNCAKRDEAAVRAAGIAKLAPHAPGFLSVSSSDLKFPRRTAR